MRKIIILISIFISLSAKAQYIVYIHENGYMFVYNMGVFHKPKGYPIYIKKLYKVGDTIMIGHSKLFKLHYSLFFYKRQSWGFNNGIDGEMGFAIYGIKMPYSYETNYYKDE